MKFNFSIQLYTISKYFSTKNPGKYPGFDIVKPNSPPSNVLFVQTLLHCL